MASKTQHGKVQFTEAFLYSTNCQTVRRGVWTVDVVEQM